MSQYKLADATGLSRSLIAKLELGQLESTGIATLMKIADVLDVALEDLLHGPKQRTDMKPLVEQFLKSPLAHQLQPPLTDSELEWLQTLPAIEWLGREPTEFTVYQLILTFRTSKPINK